MITRYTGCVESRAGELVSYLAPDTATDLYLSVFGCLTDA